jgi:hypothetical protein
VPIPPNPPSPFNPPIPPNPLNPFSPPNPLKDVPNPFNPENPPVNEKLNIFLRKLILD